jgi:hypothetical protein
MDLFIGGCKDLHNGLSFCAIKKYQYLHEVKQMSGGELLEMRLLDSHLLDTFGSKSIARHKFYQLLKSS